VAGVSELEPVVAEHDAVLPILERREELAPMDARVAAGALVAVDGGELELADVDAVPSRSSSSRSSVKCSPAPAVSPMRSRSLPTSCAIVSRIVLLERVRGSSSCSSPSSDVR
jgi:hypothetical protein